MKFTKDYLKMQLELLNGLLKISKDQYKLLAGSNDGFGNSAEINILNKYYDPIDEKNYYAFDTTDKERRKCEKGKESFYCLKSQYEVFVLNEYFDFHPKRRKHVKLNVEELADYIDFASLVGLVQEKLSFDKTPSKEYTRSTFLKYKYCNLTLGGMQYYIETSQGQKSNTEANAKDLLPTRHLIFPTKVNDDGTLYLNIPKKIVKAFDICPEDRYWLGTRLESQDTLFMFPEKNFSNDFCISTISPDFIDVDPEEGGNYRTFSSEIVIWDEPITIGASTTGTLRLRIPQSFFKRLSMENSMIDKSNDPAFSLSFDMNGNLVYERMLFFTTDEHEEYNLAGIKLSCIPELIDYGVEINAEGLLKA